MTNSKSLKSNKSWFCRWSYPRSSKRSDSSLTKAFLYLNKQAWENYHKFFGFFRSKYQAVIRSVSWARFGRDNYDHDFSYVYETIAFKLKKLETCFENGYAVHQHEDMDALYELIEITSRLAKDKYEEIYYDLHDLKWGGLPKMRFSSLIDEAGADTGLKELLPSARYKVKNDRDVAKEKKERYLIYASADLDRRNDIDRMCEIFKNHSRNLWD